MSLTRLSGAGRGFFRRVYATSFSFAVFILSYQPDYWFMAALNLVLLRTTLLWRRPFLPVRLDRVNMDGQIIHHV